jgi:hypothetical protein
MIGRLERAILVGVVAVDDVADAVPVRVEGVGVGPGLTVARGDRVRLAAPVFEAQPHRAGGPLVERRCKLASKTIVMLVELGMRFAICNLMRWDHSGCPLEFLEFRTSHSGETLMIPSTVARVPEHTAGHINERIRDRIESNVARYADADPSAIDGRLMELDREWDMERTLEANAATIALFGLGLGTFVDRRFYLLPAVVAGFLLQHAIQGWCPPMPVFRRLGVRTAAEIEEERYALKALRGDFQDVPSGDRHDPGRVGRALQAVAR